MYLPRLKYDGEAIARSQQGEIGRNGERQSLTPHDPLQITG